jgi:O-6-methylguanine DNA methyltransferase
MRSWGDCIVGDVRVERHLYAAPGWGVGEIWVRGRVLVQHELASEALAAEAERADEAAAALVPAGAPPGGGPRAGAAREPQPRNGGARRPARTLPPGPSRAGDGFVPDLCRRLAAHLAGEQASYEDIEIDLDWATPFQRELAAAARAIPWGEVVSYGELAALAGRPGAARAAGSFCAGNRYSLVIPCHRVVAASGIGGYGSAGPQLKRRLLALEGVRM